ncbi:MAG: hypothetical protein N5P05_003030 [Chroococcopsis gigantea SAG 12.99]|jgi:pyridoxamine 5'-phosphate oxidase|nr:hypothetical protein [Chroococcopsis gigantea SAG 12.99]
MSSNPTPDSIAPWRPAIAKALHLGRRSPQSRYFQLATTGVDGRPSNRTVVFRGYLEPSNTIQIITDTRSEKIRDLQTHPWGEICWYFAETREQFRLSGRIEVVTGESAELSLQKARYVMWKNISGPARAQFAWPFPGKPRKEDKELFSASELDAERPLDNFALLLFVSDRVDHLQLRGEPQNRRRYWLEAGVWHEEEVNP